MFKHSITVLGSVFVALYASAAFSQSYVPGEVIVKLKSPSGSFSTTNFLGKTSKLHRMVLKQSWKKLNIYHFKLANGQRVRDAVASLKQDPNVLYAEPNYYLTASDANAVQQLFTAQQVQAAAVQAQGVDEATSAPIGVTTLWSASGSVPTQRPIVAVIDTGIDTSHYVFTDTDAIWTNPNEVVNGIDDDNNGYIDDVHGWNFVSDTPNVYDDNGHGTHVSGIILSVDQNIYSTPLQQAKIQIMPLKFLDGNGVGTTSNAIRAIYYAVNNGATVLNNSWGGNDYSAALNEAIAYTYTKGALFVAAAGNNSSDNDSTPMYPASYDVPNIISVAATTDYDYLAPFSNYGASTVALGSPGVDIFSTYPPNAQLNCTSGCFAYDSGTSMATPFVSGTAAQMKVASPNMLGYQIKQILLGQDTQVSQLYGKVSTNGRLESDTAVAYAKSAVVSTTQPAYTLTYQSDRQLASNLAGGGCGLVSALGNGKEPPFGASAAAVLVLLALPLLLLAVMRMRSPANRRQHERFKIASDVRISLGDRELVGSLSSISLGGVQVNTAALLQDGGLLTLTISSPDGREKVEVAGRVVWSEANKAYGVAFDHAPQSALSRIADWTRSLQKAS